MGGGQSAPAVTQVERPQVTVNPSIGETSEKESLNRMQREIYNKGLNDGASHVMAQQEERVAELKSQVDRYHQERKEAQAREVQRLVSEFDAQHPRPPVREVKCGDERAAVIQCLESQADPLACGDLTAVFEACAFDATAPLIKRGAPKRD